VVALNPVAAIHVAALAAFPESHSLIHKLVGMVLQISGGLLVLWSVNDNLGLFRSESLAHSVLRWLKEFPFVRPPITLHASSAASSTSFGTPRLRVDSLPTTLEERVQRLERLLGELKQDLNEEVSALRREAVETRETLHRQISHSSNKLAELTTRIENATVGGVKLQAMGVFFAIYGAIISVFA
jgi:hypothetical protein